jgi:predicted DNA-binding transcriptional regulator AlpA
MTPASVVAALRSDALVVDVDVVAAALGVSKWSVYDQVRAGTFPIEPIRLGRSIRFRVSDVCALVGIAAPLRT